MRRPLLTAMLTAVSAVTFPAGIALGCDAGSHSRAASHPDRTGRAPLLIGDSTSIIATPMLGRLGIEADAHGCRQFGHGVQMIAARRANHTLPHVVVLALGANGPIGDSQISAALRIIGPSRILALVTARRSAASDAAMYRAARRHPDRVLLVDWDRRSARHGGWFAVDGLHVGQEGATAFARLIRRAIAPFAFPPVRRLKISGPAGSRKQCGPVRRRKQTLVVSVARGEGRITCSRARTVVRRSPLRPLPGWKAFDWRVTGHSGFSWVYVRRDRKVVIGARSARRLLGRGRHVGVRDKPPGDLREVVNATGMRPVCGACRHRDG